MKNKGFTLIELLAVILILGIIALIAIPTVTSVVEQSRRGAAEQSVTNYIKGIDEAITMSQMSGNTPILDGTYTIAELLERGVELKGEVPSYGIVTIEHSEVVSYDIRMNDFILSNNGTGKPIKKILPNSNDTHLGVVYLDPTDLTKACTKEEASNNMFNDKYTDVKKGCMKWYIYNEDENNYFLILDHNTTSKVAWNSEWKTDKKEIKTQFVIDTLEWNKMLSPRLITKEEVDKIANANTSKVYWLEDGVSENPSYMERVQQNITGFLKT